MWREELKDTGNPYYLELERRMTIEKDLSDRTRRIPSGRYGVYVKVGLVDFWPPRDLIVGGSSYRCSAITT